MAKQKTDFEKRLAIEEQELTRALISVQDNPSALAALRGHLDRLAQFTEERYQACKGKVDATVADFWAEIGTPDPVPKGIEEWLMSFYLLELERTDEERKVCARLQETAAAHRR
jgi:hypothetical protein